MQNLENVNTELARVTSNVVLKKVSESTGIIKTVLVYFRKNEQEGLLIGEHLTTTRISAELVSPAWKRSHL